MPTPMPPPAAPLYKIALLTWVGAYPVITVIIAVLGPPTARWPLPLRTLLISVLMVVALTWGVLPALRYVLRGWLKGKPHAQRSAAPMNSDHERSL